MNYLTKSSWLDRRKGAPLEQALDQTLPLVGSHTPALSSGAGLEDLEDILSAPTPSLGAPLRRAPRNTAQEVDPALPTSSPGEQGTCAQKGLSVTRYSTAHSASDSPKISPKSCSAAESPGRASLTADNAAEPDELSSDAVA